MVMMTMIARVADGLPLAATMQDDEQVISLLKIMSYPIIIFDFVVWQKHGRVSETSQNVIPQIRPSITSQVFHRDRPVFIPVCLFALHILYIYYSCFIVI